MNRENSNNDIYSDKDEIKTNDTLYYEQLQHFNITMQEDPRIREQDFGNYQNPEDMKKRKKERTKFGHFYYR